MHGWAAHKGPIELGAKISAAVINKPLVDAVVTTLMPGALLWKTLALGTKWTFKAGKHVAEGSMGAVAAQHMAVNKEAAANAWRYRAYQAAYSQAFHPTPEPRSSFPTSPFSAVDGLPDRITRQPPLPTLRRPCDTSQPCSDSLSRGADFTRFAPPPPPAAFPSSKSGPGGVDTAQLALTYVEKQGRPVTTVFTLNYLPMVGGGG